mgnify:CR=1 FL=1
MYLLNFRAINRNAQKTEYEKIAENATAQKKTARKRGKCGKREKMRENAKDDKTKKLKMQKT